MAQNISPGPGQVAKSVATLSVHQKGGRFDSESGCIPRFRFNPRSERMWEATD